ncbi:MAG: septum formation initiator family protein [Blautia sp.]|nr:septum formation initiator family protein [Blautia sp.]
MAAVALVVLFLLGTVIMKSRELEERLAYYVDRTASLDEEIQREYQRKTEIANLKQYMTTDEYAEEVARSRLGLVKENEIVFQEAKETH